MIVTCSLVVVYFSSQWQSVLDIIAKALFDNNMEFSQINGIHKFQVCIWSCTHTYRRTTRPLGDTFLSFLFLFCLQVFCPCTLYLMHHWSECSRRTCPLLNTKRRSTSCFFLSTRAPMGWTSSRPLTCCWWSLSSTQPTSSRPSAGCTASARPSKNQGALGYASWHLNHWDIEPYKSGVVVVVVVLKALVFAVPNQLEFACDTSPESTVCCLELWMYTTLPSFDN